MIIEAEVGTENLCAKKLPTCSQNGNARAQYKKILKIGRGGESVAGKTTSAYGLAARQWMGKRLKGWGR